MHNELINTYISKTVLINTHINARCLAPTGVYCLSLYLSLSFGLYDVSLSAHPCHLLSRRTFRHLQSRRRPEAIYRNIYPRPRLDTYTIFSLLQLWIDRFFPDRRWSDSRWQYLCLRILYFSLISQSLQDAPQQESTDGEQSGSGGQSVMTSAEN